MTSLVVEMTLKRRKLTTNTRPIGFSGAHVQPVPNDHVCLYTSYDGLTIVNELRPKSDFVDYDAKVKQITNTSNERISDAPQFSGLLDQAMKKKQTASQKLLIT